MSDRHIRTLVYFSDFVRALRSLVLPDKFAAVAICELTEQATQKQLTETSRYEVGIFSSVNFGWVLSGFAKNHAALKCRIFSEIFHIDQVPKHALRNAWFFREQDGSWEPDGDRIHPSMGGRPKPLLTIFRESVIVRHDQKLLGAG